MPKSFVLWGSAGHAKVLAEAIAKNGGRVISLFDNAIEVPSAIPGVLVHLGEAGFLAWADAQPDIRSIAGLAAIGGGRGRDRLAIQALFRKRGLHIPVLTHPNAEVSASAHIGAGTQVLALANVAVDVRLGEACIVNHKASVNHECNVGNGVHLAPGATVCGCVNVGDNVFVGAGAIILPRLSIGADAIIGAGSVVTRNVPAGQTVVGNPARIVKKLFKD